MFDLQTTVKQATLDSREVAEMVEKRHADLMRDIRTYESYLTGAEMRSLDFFIPKPYADNKGEERPGYQITRKGCEFIAHKMTGQKGALFTAKYIERFHKMEQAITGNGMSVAQMLNKQVAIVIDEVDNLNGRVHLLENTMTVDFGQQNRLQTKGRETALRVLGGSDSPAYANKSLRSKVFSTLWRDYKDYFAVASYRDTSRVDFDKAMTYLANWRAQGALLREIEIVNASEEAC